jgi:nucleotide-binding universal stress UspA family protein
VNSRYIVGMDGGAAGERALAWALRRATVRPAPVVLVHVAELPPDSYAEQPVALLAEPLARARARHPRLDISTVELAGSAPTALAAFVTPDDLLVIGTHQHPFPRTPVERCGSWEIASACACSVAVIPDADMHLRSGVVVGIDHHASGARLARIAAAEAALFGDDLTVVQSVPPTAGSQRAGLAIEDAISAARENTTTAVTSLLSRQNPADALVRSAHARALLIIGESTSRTPSPGAPTVLREVLTSLPVPVLVVRGISGVAA